VTITVDLFKQRKNTLIDELRRIEGAIREIDHAIAWMEKEDENALRNEKEGQEKVGEK
jgi:hypothetical protein